MFAIFVDDLHGQEFEDRNALLAEIVDRAAGGTNALSIVDDVVDDARFGGENDGGTYDSDLKSFAVEVGRQFILAIFPQVRVEDLVGMTSFHRGNTPLISIDEANAGRENYITQLADVTGDGHTFAFEDKGVGDRADGDFDDVLIQFRGAVGAAPYIDEVKLADSSFYESDNGKALVSYAIPYITPVVQAVASIVADFDIAVDDVTDLALGVEEVAIADDPAPQEPVAAVSSSSWGVDFSELLKRALEGSSVAASERGSSSAASTVNGATSASEDSGSDVVTNAANGATPASVSDSGPSVDFGVNAMPQSVAISMISDPGLPTVTDADQPLVISLDTGVAAENPGLDEAKISSNPDLVNGDDSSRLAEGEGNEHGTHTIGIISAKPVVGQGDDPDSTEDDITHVGINPGAPVVVAQVTGSGQLATAITQGVDAAKESGRNGVMYLALDLVQTNNNGGNMRTRYVLTDEERVALDYARQNDVTIVVAAGNQGAPIMSALGQASQEFENLLTVGSAEVVDGETSLWKGTERTDYSSYGRGLDVVSLGGTAAEPVVSLVGDGLGTMFGTSVATAQVAGVVSLIRAANPGLSSRQVVEIIKETATDLEEPGWDRETGAGLVNLEAAVWRAKEVEPEVWEPVPFAVPTTFYGEGTFKPSEIPAALSLQLPGGSTKSITEGITHTIQWDSPRPSFGTVSIYWKGVLSNGGPSQRTIASDISDSGYYIWTPESLPNALSYKLQIGVRGAHYKSVSNVRVLEDYHPLKGADDPPPEPPPEDEDPSPVDNLIVVNGYKIEGNIYPVYQNYSRQLGNPKYLSYQSNGMTVQRFDGGRIVSGAYGTFPVLGQFEQKYGLVAHSFGAPLGKAFSVGGGVTQQNFEGGYIYFNGVNATIYEWDRTPPVISNPPGSSDSDPGNSAGEPIPVTNIQNPPIPGGKGPLPRTGTGLRTGIRSDEYIDTYLHLGEIFARVQLEPSHRGKKHQVTINWGAWKWTHVVELPADEDYYVVSFDKNDFGNVPLTVSVTSLNEDPTYFSAGSSIEIQSKEEGISFDQDLIFNASKQGVWSQDTSLPPIAKVPISKKYSGLTDSERLPFTERVSAFPKAIYGSPYTTIKTPGDGKWTRFINDGDVDVVFNPSIRNSEQLERVVGQFDVGNNPRYKPIEVSEWDEELQTYVLRDKTACNIFIKDAMFLLNAELPYWVDGKEQTAFSLLTWMQNNTSYWKKISASEATATANLGIPVVAAASATDLDETQGHIAVVLPSLGETDKIHVAAAGLVPSSRASIADSFGQSNVDVVQYFKYVR